MDENKRKRIEAKLLQLFTQTNPKEHATGHTKKTPTVVKVIRRRKGKPDLQVA
jgi:Ribonuclease G/E